LRLIRHELRQSPQSAVERLYLLADNRDLGKHRMGRAEVVIYLPRFINPGFVSGNLR
jgi:hypothetical protein